MLTMHTYVAQLQAEELIGSGSKWVEWTSPAYKLCLAPCVYAVPSHAPCAAEGVITSRA